MVDKSFVVVPIGYPIQGQNRLAEPDANHHKFGPQVPCNIEIHESSTAVGE